MNFKNPEGQVARWLETLSSFTFTVEHRRGRLHGNADGLSRIPCKQCGLDDTQRAEEGNDSETVQFIAADDGLDLKSWQESDRDLKLVMRWVSDGKRPLSPDISSENYFVKTLWSHFSHLENRNGLLVRRYERQDVDETVYQVIVPLKYRREILHNCHDVRTAGHLGIRKTLQRIRQKFYWPSIRRDVRAYVTGCEVCLKRKGPIQTKRAPMQTRQSGYPMERIAVDILGELPTTEGGNRYILVPTTSRNGQRASRCQIWRLRPWPE